MSRQYIFGTPSSKNNKQSLDPYGNSGYKAATSVNEKMQKPLLQNRFKKSYIRVFSTQSSMVNSGFKMNNLEEQQSSNINSTQFSEKASTKGFRMCECLQKCQKEQTVDYGFSRIRRRKLKSPQKKPKIDTPINQLVELDEFLHSLHDNQA